MLSRTVPSNRNGSCEIIATRLLKTLKGSVFMSTLSIKICPRVKFETLSIALIIELLPAPVRPHIPILSYDAV